MPAGGTWVGNDGFIGFIAADTTITAAYLRVKLSGDHSVTVAGLTDDTIGVARAIPISSGDPVTILPLNKSGTVPMVANGVISQNARVYAAASGKISATPDGRPLGFALEAASGDGSVIEVYPIEDAIGAGAPDVIVQTKTANYTVVAADIGTLLVANGAGEVDFTLPAPAASLVGARVEFLSIVDQIMGILGAAATDLIAKNNTGAASVKFQSASNKIGARAVATCISATKWAVSAVGDLTVTVA